MKWKANEQAVVQRLGNNMVVVDLESDRILELNETAARLYELASSGLTLAEMASKVSQEFDVEEQEAEREISAAMKLLVQERIVEAYAV